MGNIFTITISALLDYVAGSVTSMLWEWIFPQYESGGSRIMTTIEGLLQLGASVATAPYLLSILTPASFGRDTTIGLIGVMYFVMLFSPNMIAKLSNAHTTMSDVLMFIPGGFYVNRTQKTIMKKKQKMNDNEQEQ